MSTPPNPRPVGERSLRSLFSADPAMTELIELFVREMPERIQALEQAWNEEEFTEVRKAAHQLCGSGGGYGFPALGQAAGALERTLNVNRPAHPGATIADARRQLDELIALCRRISV